MKRFGAGLMLALAACTAVSAGCARRQEIVEQNRAALEAKLRSIYDSRYLVKGCRTSGFPVRETISFDNPPLSYNGTGSFEGAVLDVHGPPPVFTYSGGNTLFAHVEDLVTDHAGPPFDMYSLEERRLRRNDLSAIIRYLSPGYFKSRDHRGPDADSLEKEISRFLNASYLIVVKEIEYLRPCPIANRKYLTGKYSAYVYLIDLAGNTCLGCFRITALNGESVLIAEFKKDGNDERKQMFLLQVTKNLRANARRVIKFGLRRLVPGSQADEEFDL